MPNPLFNPQVQQLMRVAQAYRDIKSNPNHLADFLHSRNIVNDEQYEEVKKMNGDASKIGQYLLDTSIMSQQNATQLYQQVPQVQQSLS